MKVTYCEKCHNKKMIGSIENALNEFKKLDNVSTVSRSCISYCGPGKDSFFAIVDDELITGDSVSDLVNQVKEF